MAGHSQFKNIMHRKGAQDAKRAKAFTKLIREITVAAQLGGGDPAANPRLRTAITAARGANMPKDNVERAIKKGTGDDNTTSYYDMRYEGYGPSGVAVIVEALTDNKNRTASEVRSAFSKYGGNMGETGSVTFMFQHVGVILYPKDVDEETLLEEALGAGATDFSVSEEGFQITASKEKWIAVRDALEASLPSLLHASLAWVPETTVEISDKKDTLLKLLSALEESDDVQNVWHNAQGI